MSDRWRIFLLIEGCRRGNLFEQRALFRVDLALLFAAETGAPRTPAGDLGRLQEIEHVERAGGDAAVPGAGASPREHRHAGRVETFVVAEPREQWQPVPEDEARLQTSPGEARSGQAGRAAISCSRASERVLALRFSRRRTKEGAAVPARLLNVSRRPPGLCIFDRHVDTVRASEHLDGEDELRPAEGSHDHGRKARQRCQRVEREPEPPRVGADPPSSRPRSDGEPLDRRSDERGRSDIEPVRATEPSDERPCLRALRVHVRSSRMPPRAAPRAPRATEPCTRSRRFRRAGNGSEASPPVCP